MIKNNIIQTNSRLIDRTGKEFVTTEDLLDNLIHRAQHTHQMLSMSPYAFCAQDVVYNHHRTVGNSNTKPTYPKVCVTIEHNMASCTHILKLNQ